MTICDKTLKMTIRDVQDDDLCPKTIFSSPKKKLGSHKSLMVSSRELRKILENIHYNAEGIL